MNSTNSRLAYDGDPTTSWSVDGSARSTFVWFDLGDNVTIGSINWLVGEVSPGLSVTVETSPDRRTWEDHGTISDVIVGDWQTIEAGFDARYIRLTVNADDPDAMVFTLAEITFAE